MKCKFCKDLSFILSCTVDENGLHHSYNDEPCYITDYNKLVWNKHGVLHRENGPAIISNYNNYYDFESDKKYESYGWFWENIGLIETRSKIINNTILMDNKIKYKKLNGKTAIVLKQMLDYDPDVYFCLVENIKIYIKLDFSYIDLEHGDFV